MRICGQAPIVWRADGQSQVGVDPAYATVIDGLSREEQHLLAALPLYLSRDGLYRTARRVGVPMPRAQALLVRLQECGVLIEGEPPRSDNAVHWERLGWDTPSLLSTLRHAVVTVLGSGPLVLATAHMLAACHVGTVITEDDIARDHLRHAFPQVTTDRRHAAKSVLVLLVNSYVTDPVRERALTQHRVPHLPITLSDVSVEIGPLLEHDSPLCRHCLDLWMCERDPLWPAVATQARMCVPPVLDTITVNQAASVATRAAMECLAGQNTTWHTRQVEIMAHEIAARVRTCAPHPECLCTTTAKACHDTIPLEESEEILVPDAIRVLTRRLKEPELETPALQRHLRPGLRSRLMPAAPPGTRGPGDTRPSSRGPASSRPGEHAGTGSGSEHGMRLTEITLRPMATIDDLEG